MRTLILFLLIAVTGALGACASTLSTNGTFATDRSLFTHRFTVTYASRVTFQTYSYGGGVMQNGTVIAAGGFHPALALFFDGSDADERFGDPDPLSGIPTRAGQVDPDTERAADAGFSRLLGRGDYRIVLSQWPNTASRGGLSYEVGAVLGPNFTEVLYGCSNGAFCDQTGQNRTNEWAFDILGLNPQPAPVPLPASAGLLILGLAGLGLRRLL